MSEEPDRVALDLQIAEVEEELTRRTDAFERDIAAKRMLPAVAARKQTRLRAVLRTLLWLQGNEGAIRAAAGRKPPEASA